MNMQCESNTYYYIVLFFILPCSLICCSLAGQSFGFSLGDEHIPNNGFAPVESIGSTDDNALVCKADRLSCCSNLVGTWLFPNGTEVPEDESIGWLFWTSHGPGVLRLHRSQEIGLGQNATGLYRCLVPTSQRATVTLHVGVYHIEDASTLNRYHLNILSAQYVMIYCYHSLYEHAWRPSIGIHYLYTINQLIQNTVTSSLLAYY